MLLVTVQYQVTIRSLNVECGEPLSTTLIVIFDNSNFANSFVSSNQITVSIDTDATFTGKPDETDSYLYNLLCELDRSKSRQQEFEVFYH